MEFKYFPEEYNSIVKKKNAERLKTENIPVFEPKVTKPKFFNDIVSCGAVGFCVGVAACLFMCFVGGPVFDLYEYFDTNVGNFIYFGGPCLITAAIGFLIGPFVHIKKKNDFQKNQEEEKNIYTKKELEAIEKRDRILREEEEECKKYEQEFEKEVRKKSAELAESKLAQIIITDITKSFIQKISEADKAPHIKEISVPIYFDVHKNQICFNTEAEYFRNSLKIFDFDRLTFKKLENCVEQVAIASVIAATVRLNICMEYQKDPTVKVVVDIKNNYRNDNSVRCTITYRANNKFYREPQSW